MSEVPLKYIVCIAACCAMLLYGINKLAADKPAFTLAGLNLSRSMCAAMEMLYA